MRARRLEICFISSKIVKFIMNKTHDIRVVFQLSYFHSFIFCIIIILSFTMTVGILMLHCGLGILIRTHFTHLDAHSHWK